MRVKRPFGAGFAIPLSLFCAFLYFSYHAVWGNRGYFAWIEKRKILAAAKRECAKVSEVRDQILQKVSLMQDRVDPDLLEQLAWTLLRRLPQHKVIVRYSKDTR